MDPRVREEIQSEGAFSTRPYILYEKARMLGLSRLEAAIR